MRLLKLLLFVSVGLYLSGCAAPQPPVSLSKEFFQNSNLSVGVVTRQPATPAFATEGDVRLLDWAIIAAATASLNQHVKTLDLAEFKEVENEIAEILRQKGFAVQVIPEFPDMEKLKSFSDPDPKDTVYFAAKDMTPLSQDLGVNFLLMLDVYRAGFARPYSGFIPLAAPRAVFDLRGELVDLKSNRLLWYAGINKANSPDGGWDEAPAFPGLTNSFYVSLEEAKKEIIDTLSSDGEDGESEVAKAKM
jgi:hypothetical protein